MIHNDEFHIETDGSGIHRIVNSNGEMVDETWASHNTICDIFNKVHERGWETGRRDLLRFEETGAFEDPDLQEYRVGNGYHFHQSHGIKRLPLMPPFWVENSDGELMTRPTKAKDKRGAVHYVKLYNRIFERAYRLGFGRVMFEEDIAWLDGDDYVGFIE